MKIVSGGTRAGSKPPGSRVTERSSRGVPSVPSSSSARAAAQSGAKRRLKPTCSTTPAARAASMARSASASDRAIGFSQNTALPAGGRGDDQVGVEPGRRRDHHGVDRPDRRAPRPDRCTPRRPERRRPASRPHPAPGRPPRPAAAPGNRRASVSPWNEPIRPDPISATRPTCCLRHVAPLDSLERYRAECAIAAPTSRPVLERSRRSARL